MEESFYPWRHRIIDNFLSQEHMNSLESYCIDYIPKDLEHEGKFSRSEIKNDGTFLSHGDLDPILAKSIFDTYTPQLKKILHQMSPRKSKLFDFCTVQFTINGSNFIYHLHDDDPSKLLSTVIYIYPDESAGTNLYLNSNPNSLKKTVRWKKNRAFIFAREGRKTWHNYQGSGLENRYTLVINLRTFHSKTALLLEPFNFNKIFLLDTYFTNKKARLKIKSIFSKLINIVRKTIFF